MYEIMHDGVINKLSELLLIEITETVLMESMDLIIEKLKILKNNNIKIALDDFGCGYSSLAYLKVLPINMIKIDKSFIDDINSEDDVKSMAGTIILLAKQLGLSVYVTIFILYIPFIYRHNSITDYFYSFIFVALIKSCGKHLLSPIYKYFYRRCI